MIRRILARAAARLNDFTNALTLARTVRLMARQLDHMHLLAASEECRADRAEERVAELELQLADWREASGELVAEEEAADLRDAGEEARSPLPSCTCHEADIQRGRAEQAERERDANARAAGAHIKTIAELRAQLAEALRAVHRPASAEQIPGVAAASPYAIWSAEYDAVEAARATAGTDDPPATKPSERPAKETGR